MAPILDGTCSHYGEPESAPRAFFLDNARLIVLLAILAGEIVWVAL